MEQEHQREVFGTTIEHSGHMINGIFTFDSDIFYSFPFQLVSFLTRIFTEFFSAN